MAPEAYIVDGHLFSDRTRFLRRNSLLVDVRPTGCRWVMGRRIIPKGCPLDSLATKFCELQTPWGHAMPPVQRFPFTTGYV